MATGRIKRSNFQTFLNTTPSSTATYSRIGEGVAAAEVAYNPETTKENFINLDQASTWVESYAPEMPIEMVANNGDAVFEFIDNLRRTRAILADAETDIVHVYAYETGGPTAYPAEKQPVCVQIDSFGGDGGKAVKIKYTLKANGAAVAGTFNASTLAFTAS